ncbi:MAG TPA: hypothetical protein VEK07_05985 [Polyangiaceae bacterium]|nr:hypothetical protein [Polyangiaceae bacterium]
MNKGRLRTGLCLVGTLLAAALAAAPGCSSKQLATLSQACFLNSDCNSPLICVFSRCHTACRNSADCPSDERCVPAGADAGTSVDVCQLAAEATCSGGSTCENDEVCGTDEQCRAPCGPSENCLEGQVCASVAGSADACFDPHDPLDSDELAAAGISSDAGVVSGDASGMSEAGDATVAPDAASGADVAASFMPNPDAGPLGFIPSNVGWSQITAAVDGGSSPGDASSEAGILADAPALTLAESGNDSSLLPAPSTIQLGDGTFASLYVFDSLAVVQSAALRFTGPLPVVIVALTSVDVQGQILVDGTGDLPVGGSPADTPGPGGFYGANGGPGAGQPCLFGSAFPNSGCGGGSYCGVGGSGAASSSPGASGGPTYGNAELVPLIGGSAGGAEQELSGPGGGAIQIVAGQQITIGIYGSINAGGGGGGGYNYAGGAGSGGAILLEAPVVTVSGALAANGGGGGEAEGSPAAGSGADSTANAQPAPGFEGIGGSGSAGPVIDGRSGALPDSGDGFGAGGGGAGRIRINTANGSATITGILSPDLTTPCATQGTLGSP